MPKEIKIVSDIPKLYKRNSISLLLFGFVRGVRQTLHTITIPQAIDMFMEDFNLDDTDVNRDSLNTIYKRMQLDLINLKKNDE